MRDKPPVWFFDLDNTLHDASHAAFGATNRAMTEYIALHLGLPLDEASALRQRYWHHYGATLLGLVRHHGVRPAHFLEQTHQLPELESRLRMSAHDRALLRRLPGRKYILTNAPRTYTLRVMGALGLSGAFDGILSIEDMTMFGEHRPKPDARMFRHVLARLKLRPEHCVLVEDTLAHQKAAHGLGMRTVWMRRYLDGRFRGTLRDGINNGRRDTKVGVHPCHKPPYVYARMNSLKTLRAFR